MTAAAVAVTAGVSFCVSPVLYPDSYITFPLAVAATCRLATVPGAAALLRNLPRGLGGGGR